MNGKRLDLLKEALPGISRVAVLWNPSGVSAPVNRQQTEITARALGLPLQILAVDDPSAFVPAFQAAREQAGALLILGDPLFNQQIARLAELAAQSRLPAMYLDREFAARGGLLSYGASQTGLIRRAAYYVDRILKGAQPADLPVEQPREFEFVINLKTAQALG